MEVNRRVLGRAKRIADLPGSRASYDFAVGRRKTNRRKRLR